MFISRWRKKRLGGLAAAVALSLAAPVWSHGAPQQVDAARSTPVSLRGKSKGATASSVTWSLLESTQEVVRRSDGAEYVRPHFPAQVRALAGTRVTVSGYIFPLEYGPTAQRHFMLLASPPDCPFHIHAQANQLIEVFANRPAPLGNLDTIVMISGVLELTGEDESGVFYRMHDALLQ